ncbi:unnamed protein product [Prorocentrum cordatum]|uniref:Uncharacterized protein n=1 Tax=Prorocentrum cordatum TaxID=2364126 RepID=A0ABN9QFB4_9DINO|nr:unnamed protein product [Polarella glacialis]
MKPRLRICHLTSYAIPSLRRCLDNCPSSSSNTTSSVHLRAIPLVEGKLGSLSRRVVEANPGLDLFRCEGVARPICAAPGIQAAASVAVAVEVAAIAAAECLTILPALATRGFASPLPANGGCSSFSTLAMRARPH